MYTGTTFTTYPIQHGFITELDKVFPTYLSAWDEQAFYSLDDAETATHYGYVFAGTATLRLLMTGQTYTVCAGQFFVVPEAFRIEGGQGIITTRRGYHGLFQLGGPVEESGRLKYIDGCTDTLLVAPTRKGDPCLNLLHLPTDIDQTMHTHPSDRIGIIMSGHGRVIYEADGAMQEKELRPGMIWVIHTGGPHKFQTPFGEDMRILAYHPDSDQGPDDENHPMLSKSFVDGVSAKDIDAIRTK